ncbi:MAG: hypothetical protein ACK5A8_08990, partial [Flavobacteriia bacterium]
MKTLISWIAQKNDFENGQFKPNGPTGGFHKYFYKDQDRQIVVSGGERAEEDVRAAHFLNFMAKEYPERVVEVRYLNIADPIDHQEIQSKVAPILAECKDDKIDIYISPGTPAMQLVWYLCHMS